MSASLDILRGLMSALLLATTALPYVQVGSCDMARMHPSQHHHQAQYQLTPPAHASTCHGPMGCGAYSAGPTAVFDANVFVAEVSSLADPNPPARLITPPATPVPPPPRS
jgi:hypothetical protein